MPRNLYIREDERGAEHTSYRVNFYDEIISVTVTRHQRQVTCWLENLERENDGHLDRLIVGFDVKCRNSPNLYDRPAAILQLCVGRSCLIFQILRVSNNNDDIPQKLRDFLAEERYTFVGVGIRTDVIKLNVDHDLRVGGRILDLRMLAAERRGNDAFRNRDLKRLSRTLLGKSIWPSGRIRLGGWARRRLGSLQIMYACLDPFVSFRIGELLNAWMTE